MATVEILLIFAVGLAPAMFSGWYVRKLRDRARRQLIDAREATATGILLSTPPRIVHTRVIGDRTCEFNARSPYLRCAINPQGPCQDCRHYSRR